MTARYPLVLNGTTIEELQSVDTLAGVDAFAAGTKSLFAQAAAPTGWTQCTTHNNKSLRLVNTSAGGSGGSVAFTTAFASQAVSGTNSGGAVAATTLTTCQMPGHAHRVLNANVGTNSFLNNTYTNPCAYAMSWSNGQPINGNNQGSANTGGGGSHTHTFTQPTFSGTAINLAVQYVDIMIATKN